MGMYDRDWYREERRQQRQPQQSSDLQPQPGSRLSGPPDVFSPVAVLAISAAVCAGLLILGFA